MASVLEEEEYNFSYPKRGLAIVINNEDFSRSKEYGDRPGSSYDASSLHDSFKAMGFDVLLFQDLPARKMVEVLKSATKDYDHFQADCFACTILSHGHEAIVKDWNGTGTNVRSDFLIGADGTALATKVVVEMFNDTNCPALKGKPRLFFIQACRGDKLDDGHSIHTVVKKTGSNGSFHFPNGVNVKEFKDITIIDEASTAAQQKSSCPIQRNKEEEEVPYVNLPLYQDCLVVYAVPPGYVSWRNSSSGSWFIQTLCQMFDSNVLEHVSLLRGLSYMCGKVAREYRTQTPHNMSMHGKQAVPVLESNLVKEVFLKKKQ